MRLLFLIFLALITTTSYAEDESATSETFETSETSENSVTANNEESELELETVTITAPKESKTKIDTSKLLKVPGAGNDPLQAVGTLPGVTFGANSRGQPAVRGSSPRDNRYIVDFMPVGYVFHSYGSSIISDNNIQDFKLESAAFAAQYNNATGAILDLQSRSPYYDSSQVVLDVSGIQAGLFVETALSENQAFYFSARRSLIQYYLPLVISDEAKKDFEFTNVPNYYDYQGKYEYKISNLERINVNLVGSNDELELLLKKDGDAGKQDPELVGNIGIANNYNSQSIIWDKFYENGLQQKIGVSHLIEKFQLNLVAKNNLDVTNTSYNLRSTFSYPISKSHELQWGVEFSQSNTAVTSQLSVPPTDEFSPPQKLIDSKETIISNDEKSITNKYDLSLGDKIALTNDWSLTPAMAFSYDDYTQQKFAEPRIQSRYEFSQGWAFTSAYGEHHQYKNFAAHSKGFGNPKLKQETANHYEIGLEHQLNDSWFWKVEAYYKELNNLITARLSKDFYSNLSNSQYLALPRYTNDAKGHAWGMELFLNKVTTDNWYGWLSVAYSKTERTHLLTQKSFRYNTDQPWIANLVANYRLKSSWELGLKWRLQSGQLVTPIVDAKQGLNPKYPNIYTPVYGELNSLRLPLQTNLDLRAQKNFRFASWELGYYFEILNTLNFLGTNVTGYAYKGADYSQRKEIKSLPTMSSFGLKATF